VLRQASIVSVVYRLQHSCDSMYTCAKRFVVRLSLKQAVMLTADRAYTAGEQVFATYGSGMSTAKKLLSFGYVEYATQSHNSNLSSNDSSSSSSSHSCDSVAISTVQLPIDGTCEIVLPAYSVQSSASLAQHQQQQQHALSDSSSAVEGSFRLLRTLSPATADWSTELNCEVLEWLQQQVLPPLRCHFTTGDAQLLNDTVAVKDAVMQQQSIAYIQQQAQQRLRQLGVAAAVLDGAVLALQQHVTNAATVSSGVTIVGTSDKHIACSVVRLGEALVWSTVLAVSIKLWDSSSVIKAEETAHS
jgi:hypothetical protein